MKEGDQAAAQPLWERYFSKLVVVARAKLKRLRRDDRRRGRRRRRPERVQQLLRRGRAGQVSPVGRSRRPLAAAGRDHRAEGDGPGQPAGTARSEEEAGSSRRPSSSGRNFDGGDGSLAGLEQIAADGPTPEFAAMMAEECRRLLDALDDDSLRQVAFSRMEGYNNDEIAAQLGCARRTVARRLDLIRKTWLATGEVA